MNSQAVPQSLQTLLADLFNIPSAQVTPNLAVGSIPAWDSVGHLQAILALESEFGVQFDPEKIVELTTVSALQHELEAKGVNLV